MTSTPRLVKYGILRWLLLHGWEMLRTLHWFSGYAVLTKEPQEVHLLVIRMLYDLSESYRAHVQDKLAHEYGHVLGIGHEDEDDLMGPTMGGGLFGRGWSTDKHNVMEKSRAWRESIRLD